MVTALSTHIHTQRILTVIVQPLCNGVHTEYQSLCSGGNEVRYPLCGGVNTVYYPLCSGVTTELTGCPSHDLFPYSRLGSTRPWGRRTEDSYRIQSRTSFWRVLSFQFSGLR